MAMSMSQPLRDTLVRYLAEDPAFAGIGYATAHRLWDALGDDLSAVLGNGEIRRLEPVLGVERAEALVETWRLRQAEGDIVVWLAENGFDGRLARKVLAIWGTDAPARLRGDPWLMLAVADFATVDAASWRLGFPGDAEARRVAAVEAVLYRRLDESHTWTGRAEVERRVADLLGCALRQASEAVSGAVGLGAVVETEGGLQPAGAAMMEATAASTIASMLEASGSGDLIAREVHPEEVDRWLDRSVGTSGIDLGEEQRAAVRLALTSRFALIVGGAGVGKTTVLKAVVAASEHFGRAVHLMALAGRAAVRMTEATGRKASTIAAFLKAVDTRQVVVGPEALLVVDESSMLDLPTFYRILRTMPASGRLLLVGDPAQLPPIGFGLTLHTLVQIPAVPRVELRTIRRQTEASGIPVVAQAIRAGSCPKLPRFDPLVAGVSLVECSLEKTAERVVDVVAELGGVRRARILSPLKGGPCGTGAMNAYFHRMVLSGRPPWERGRFVPGEPVVFLRNDYRRGLRNGSLGEITAVDDGRLATAIFDGIEHRFADRELDELDHAFAITVHKAQGSGFDAVVMPVVASRLLDRSLVYTAVTRAVGKVVLVGSWAALRQVIDRPPTSASRETGMFPAAERALRDRSTRASRVI